MPVFVGWPSKVQVVRSNDTPFQEFTISGQFCFFGETKEWSSVLEFYWVASPGVSLAD